MEPWIEVFKSFGAVAGVAVFFLLRLRQQDAETRAREERMAKRLDEQQDEFVETLKTLVEKSNDAMSRNAEVIRDMVEELKRRPCMMGVEPQRRTERT